MKNFMVMAVLAALLAACGDGDPNDDEGEVAETDDVAVGGGDTGNEEDEETDGGAVIENGTANVGDLVGSSYDADTETLSVTISLNADTATTLYGREAGALTLNGYDRFVQQDEPTDRYFVGLAKESDDGSVQATVVQDGGQFNRFFGGAIAEQNNYSAPSAGLASYAGAYVGLLNFGPPATPAAGGDPSIEPGTPTEVTGAVFLNADFNDNKINGSIYDREADLDNDGTPDDLATVVLTADDFAADGTFTGSVELSDKTGVGTYGGVFGGDDAAAVAGVVNLSGASFLDGVSLSGGGGPFEGDDAQNEYGIFVINQCTSGAPDCVGSEAIDE